MEKSQAYFLDTYALIEIIKDNRNFQKFKNTLNFTSFMNLLELCYIISKDFGFEKANKIVDKLKNMVINIDLNDVKDASKFRLKNIKNKFSYIDCLGYVMAVNRNLKFLTGDQEFKNIKNVEFVK